MSNVRIMLSKCLRLSRRNRSCLGEKLEGMNLKVGGRFWSNTYVKCVNNLTVLTEVVSRQCNVIAAHRLRRTSQVINFYQKLYGGQSQILMKLGEFLRNNCRGKSGFALAATLFSMQDEKIPTEEMDSCVEDLNMFFDVKDGSPLKTSEKWEKLLDQPEFKLWRSPVPGSDLYQYRVFGTYKDIPAVAFYHIQVDLEYRKKWDQHVIKLETIDMDEQTGSEVVHWITKYPAGFMYNRDYVYVRRYTVDHKKGIMIISSRAVEHPDCPVDPEIVRVGIYKSQMIIRPHTTFDKNGLDYVMSYYDEPQLSVPTRVINWMTYKSLPGFIKELHDAAKTLQDGVEQGHESGSYSNSWYQNSPNHIRNQS